MDDVYVLIVDELAEVVVLGDVLDAQFGICHTDCVGKVLAVNVAKGYQAALVVADEMV